MIFSLACLLSSCVISTPIVTSSTYSISSSNQISYNIYNAYDDFKSINPTYTDISTLLSFTYNLESYYNLSLGSNDLTTSFSVYSSNDRVISDDDILLSTYRLFDNYTLTSTNSFNMSFSINLSFEAIQNLKPYLIITCTNQYDFGNEITPEAILDVEGNYMTFRDNTVFSIYDKTNSLDYQTGYSYGYNEGYNTGYPLGNEHGYKTGYSTGFEDGVNTLDPIGFETLVSSVSTVPTTIFSSLFNFNILGINILALITGLLTLLIVLWLVRKLK